MKKLLLVLLSALVLFCIAIYIFIPGKLNITSSAVVHATDIATERFIIDENKWGNWWNYSNQYAESNNPQHGKVFISSGYEFKSIMKYYKSADILIHNHEQQLESKLIIIPLAVDSTGIEWKCSFSMGSDPFTRLTRYREAKQVKKILDEVLNNLKLFLSKNENVYGINIERNYLKDTLYVAAKSILPTYPSTQDIYALIKKIQVYADKNGANQTGNPIFNVSQIENSRFQLMAAVPLDKPLKELDGFSMKHMVKGSFMITEVVGGEYAVNKASKSLQQYFQDYRKTSMAMNFTMLITDRLYQPDSTKWITRLYLPVY